MEDTGDDEGACTITCNNTNRLFPNKRSAKQPDTYKSFGSIVTKLFSDHAVALCVLSLRSKEFNDKGTKLHALLYPFENAGAIFHIFPEVSEIDIELICSNRGNTASVSPFILSVGASPGSQRVFSSQNNSPNEVCSTVRSSPNICHFQKQTFSNAHSQRVPSAQLSSGSMLGIHNLSHNIIKQKRPVAIPIVGGVGVPLSASRMKLNRRINSLNSLLQNSQQNDTNVPGNRSGSAFEASCLERNRKSRSNTVVESTPPSFSVTPDDQMPSDLSGCVPQIDTGSTVIYTPPVVDAFSRLEQDLATSPTVRYKLSNIKASIEFTASPSPPAHDIVHQKTATTPVQLDTGSMLFYSPASFTHECLVEDGDDGSRSIMVDLAELPVGSRSGACSTGGSMEKITENKSLFALVMGSDRGGKLGKSDAHATSPPPVEIVQECGASDFTNSISLQIDAEEFSLEMDRASNEIDTGSCEKWKSPALATGIGEKSEEETRAANLSRFILGTKLLRNKKRPKKFEKGMVKLISECIIYHTLSPADTAKKLCVEVDRAVKSLVDVAINRPIDSINKIMLDCYQLFETITQQLILEPTCPFAEGKLQERNLAALYSLNLFFVVESVKTCKNLLKAQKGFSISRKQYQSVFQQAKGELFNCIDKLVILFKTREGREFFASIDIEWVLNTGTKDGVPSALKAGLSLLDLNDEPINFVKFVCEILRDVYSISVPDLMEALTIYDDEGDASSANIKTSAKSGTASVVRSSSSPQLTKDLTEASSISHIKPFLLHRPVPIPTTIQRNLSAGNLPNFSGSLANDESMELFSLSDNFECSSQSQINPVSSNASSIVASASGKKTLNTLLGAPRRASVNGNRTGGENRLRRTVSSSCGKSCVPSRKLGQHGVTTSASGMISRGPAISKGHPSRPPVAEKSSKPGTDSISSRLSMNMAGADSLKNENGKRSRGRSNFVESTPLSKLRR